MVQMIPVVFAHGEKNPLRKTLMGWKHWVWQALHPCGCPNRCDVWHQNDEFICASSKIE
jgi:hypothetical protein